jgi:hypothetical protein
MELKKLPETDLVMSVAGDDEYQRLMVFFAENHLEVDAEEAVPTDVIRTWKITPLAATRWLVPLPRNVRGSIIDGIALMKTTAKTNIGKNPFG